MSKTDEITVWFQGPIKTVIENGFIKVTGIQVSENVIDDSQSSREEKINRLIDYIEHMKHLDLSQLERPKEYYYSCLPLCLLDAVYSIGVRYSCARNVVKRYCDKYNIDEFQIPETDEDLSADKNHIIDNLIDNINQIGARAFAERKVENLQKTSSKNGILKSEAVLLCAEKLKEAGIHTIQDFNNTMGDPISTQKIENDFKSVRGQSSGLSFLYLKMLCGDEDQVKPERYILRFLSQGLGYEVSSEEADDLFAGIVQKLQKSYPDLTVRQLDYKIWKAMR